jgi:hypothetical protein
MMYPYFWQLTDHIERQLGIFIHKHGRLVQGGKTLVYAATS